MSAASAALPQSLALAAPDRRRAGQRYVTIFRAGRLTRAGGDELCLVRNISAGGAMVHVDRALAVGERIALDMALGDPVAGGVVWAKATRAGIAFDAPVDIEALLARHEADGRRARAPRLDVAAPARLAIGERVVLTEVENISQSGARLVLDAEPPPNRDLRLAIDGLDPMLVVPRWFARSRLGVSFVARLDLWRLNDWVRGLRQSA